MEVKRFADAKPYEVPNHRAYAMSLLNSITPSQRWGIGQVEPVCAE